MNDVSDRVISQRIRNRVMEEFWGLTHWERSLETAGFNEFFESFYDWFGNADEAVVMAAMTDEEVSALVPVRAAMDQACSAMPNRMSEADFVASGWPQKIAPLAETALRLMLARGRFSEDREEVEPSISDGWPWCECHRASPIPPGSEVAE